MSQDTPSIAEQVAALESDLSDVQESSTLASLRDRAEDIGATVERLPGVLKQARDRGYIYKNYLGNKVKVLAGQWDELKPQVEREIRTQQAGLQRALQTVEAQMTKLRAAGSSPTRAKPLIRTVEGGIKDLEGKISAAERAITGMFDTVETNIRQTNSQVEEIAWLLDQVDQSVVEWTATERPIMGVQAKWWREGKKKGPDGVLYLTNERLIFEQKEDVATKKVLFIATEKETLQEFLLAAPIGAIEDVKAKHMGLGGGQDHIDLTFGSGVDYPTAHFHLHGQDCEMWQATINRVKSGEIEREMIALSAAERERMAQEDEARSKAPTACPTCGATFTQPITKGMREITCEYCGSVTRF